MTGNIPHADLPALYQNARINLFASFTENCPNILLEMMASGRPALVSNRAPMNEFGVDTVAYFDPSNPEDLARHLIALNFDEDRQLRLGSDAMNRAALHTWEVAAGNTWKALEKTGQKLSN